MAYIANTAFAARITNNQFNDLCNITGKYYVSTTPTDCSAGLLCVRDSLLDCEGFTDVKNENAWKMVMATSSAGIDDVIYACNTYDARMISDGDNLYYIGHNVLGLGVPAGRYGTFTKIEFDGDRVYRFGIGNLSAAISTNKFFTINNGLLVPTASAPATAGKIYFELVGTGRFTEGTSESFIYYDVIAKKVTA